MGKSLITPGEVKIFLQMSGSTQDDLIENLIPVVASHIENHCNNNFASSSSYPYVDSPYSLTGYYTVDSGVKDYPEGLKLPASLMIKHLINSIDSNISSETIGAYSVTYNNNYPNSILGLLTPYKRITIV